MAKPKIVFFGSGPVAAKSLGLLADDFLIEAVITKPKPKHHRGAFPVLDLANKLDIPLYTVSNKPELSELIAKKPFKSRLGVLIDFGIIVGQDVIDYFPLGIINSHFSLLPEWRGADPITFSILSGQKQTGISLMLLVAAMDEGPLLAQAPCDLSDNITTPELTDDLIELSDATLKKILPLYITGELQPAPQEAVTIAASKQPTYSRKLSKEDGLIDWNKTAEQLEREIRAFIEWPKSRTHLGSTEVIITEADVVQGNGQPGVVSTENKQLVVFCGRDALRIKKLKPVNKSEMTAAAFLAGHAGKLASN